MPPETPVTTPVDPLTVAIAVLALLQLPGTTLGSDSVVVNPGQKADVPPVIAGGYTFTVTVTFAELEQAPLCAVAVIVLIVVAGVVVG